MAVGIRETLNQKPAITTAATLIIIAAALAVIVYQSWESDGGHQAMPTKAWFTIDDGKTWFVDDISKPSPYEYNGKAVYRVFVFTCDGGKTTFAAYLQRGNPDGADAQVKAPLSSDADWIKRDDPKAATLLEPKCKGSDQVAVAVQP
jgi:hypothetical protein